MTGTGTGGFDFSWLLDCLEIGRINIGQADEYVEVDGLYLSHKGLAAAEGYVLARFHLYSQVYLHKTTRSAERMLAALLHRAANLIRGGKGDAIGLSESHPLARFFRSVKPDVRSYLTLDDAAVWSGLGEMTEAADSLIRELAVGLRDRKLFKCIDIGELAKRHASDSATHFKRLLNERLGSELGISVLKDEAWLTAYGLHQYEDPGAFQKVLIGRPDGSGRSDDITERSTIVESIKRQRIFRVYCGDSTKLQQVEQLWKEVVT
jgi:HD superfamily phosphohydrolase